MAAAAAVVVVVAVVIVVVVVAVWWPCGVVVAAAVVVASRAAAGSVARRPTGVCGDANFGFKLPVLSPLHADGAARQTPAATTPQSQNVLPYHPPLRV